MARFNFRAVSKMRVLMRCLSVLPQTVASRGVSRGPGEGVGAMAKKARTDPEPLVRVAWSKCFGLGAVVCGVKGAGVR